MGCNRSSVISTRIWIRRIIAKNNPETGGRIEIGLSASFVHLILMWGLFVN